MHIAIFSLTLFLYCLRLVQIKSVSQSVNQQRKQQKEYNSNRVSFEIKKVKIVPSSATKKNIIKISFEKGKKVP